MTVIIGIDPHKASHTAVARPALHPGGRLFGEVTPGPTKHYAFEPTVARGSVAP